MDATKKAWKTPVLHTRSVEETLGASVTSAKEDTTYNPADAPPS